ncbi:terminase small subunit [Streptomyces sp. NBC_00566]|uniref:terminase small subunit n=1 Tax=Streptomyces sp. NBC_00566 TaxID=2975778 RepID=UPI002E800EF3|nr:terminase small subunit [Streptomyces sp. NBC_00566]WUB88218.1 terminase small subunit [Streptomyces sp. NBC_00566]
MTAQTLAERSAILAPTGLEPMLNSDELRAHYGVSLWTVNQWRKAGCPMERLPGGRRRFNLAAVRQWLAAQEETGAEISAERARKAVAARA